MMGNRPGLIGVQQPSTPIKSGPIHIGNESAEAVHMQQMQAADLNGFQPRRPNEPSQSPVMRGSGYGDYPQNSPGRQRVNSQNSHSDRSKMMPSNLPTSVLRQLSAKSSDSPGRTTSPIVNKQIASYSTTQQRIMPASQYPQHPDPAIYGYNSLPMYQRGPLPPSVGAGYPGSPMEMAGHNMTVEQMMQMRNNLQSSNTQSPRGAMPPMPMMGNMPPYPPYMMGNSPGSMPTPLGYPSDMRPPPPKEHFMGMLPGANMPNGKDLFPVIVWQA